MTRKSFNLFAAALAVAVLTGCQSSSPSPSTETSSSASSSGSQSRCEQLKRESFYNTSTGRAIANATCSGVFTKMSAKESNLWVHREAARQRGCVATTGKLCED